MRSGGGGGGERTMKVLFRWVASSFHGLHAEHEHERAVHWNTLWVTAVPFGHVMTMGMKSHVSRDVWQHLQLVSKGL